MRQTTALLCFASKKKYYIWIQATCRYQVSCLCQFYLLHWARPLSDAFRRRRVWNDGTTEPPGTGRRDGRETAWNDDELSANRKIPRKNVFPFRQNLFFSIRNEYSSFSCRIIFLYLHWFPGRFRVHPRPRGTLTRGTTGSSRPLEVRRCPRRERYCIQEYWMYLFARHSCKINVNVEHYEDVITDQFFPQGKLCLTGCDHKWSSLLLCVWCDPCRCQRGRTKHEL